MSALAANLPPPHAVPPAPVPVGEEPAPAGKGVLRLERFAVDLVTEVGVVPVVHGIDLSVGNGEALGIVGESGCGKSVTWLAALGLLGRKARVSGRALLAGEDLVETGERRRSALRGGRIALVFQDPTGALNPLHRVGRQIGETLRLHRGLRGRAARAEAERLLGRVGLPDPARQLDRFPHELSGGMNQRVAIAITLAGQPDVLIADEPTTALDATVQAQILSLLARVRDETGTALVLVSHDLGAVAALCGRVAVMYAGRIVEVSPVRDILDRPRHPYTRGLIGALPELDGPRRRLFRVGGAVPAPGAFPPGCAFAPRCPHAVPACTEAVPPLLAAGSPAHRAACIRIGEVALCENVRRHEA